MRKALSFTICLILLLCSNPALAEGENPYYRFREGELIKEIAPVFDTAEWAGWDCVCSQLYLRYGKPNYAQAIMQNGEDFALCALFNDINGNWIIDIGKSALYKGVKPSLGLCENDKHTLEKGEDVDSWGIGYQFAVNYEGGEAYVYFYGSNGVMLQSVRIGRYTFSVSPRTLIIDERYYFNTQSSYLKDFDISAFPRTEEQARILGAQSPEADPNTALTTMTEHPDVYGTPAIPLYVDKAGRNRIFGYFEGVEAKVIGMEGGMARVSIGSLNGYMPRENLLIGEEKARKYASGGDPGVASLDYPNTSMPYYADMKLDSEALGSLAPHEGVNVYGVSDSGEWLQIERGGVIGFAPSDKIAMSDNMHMGYVNNPDPKDRLNLREKPGRSSKSLGRYYSGTEVEFLFDIAPSREWSRVKIGSVTGYMMSEYLSFGNSSPGWLPPSGVLSGERSIIDKPSPSSVLAVLPKGERVEILGFIGDLAHVRAESGYIGYVPLSDVGGEPKTADNGARVMLRDYTDEQRSVKKEQTVYLTERARRRYMLDDEYSIYWAEPQGTVFVRIGDNDGMHVPREYIEGNGW